MLASSMPTSHINLHNLSTQQLHLSPFVAWGLDVVGLITPKSTTGHSYILATTDYFSKWAKAIPLREVKRENVIEFIRTHNIYQYGVPRYAITITVSPSSVAY